LARYIKDGESLPPVCDKCMIKMVLVEFDGIGDRSFIYECTKCMKRLILKIKYRSN
jgi:hypothetical protein